MATPTMNQMAEAYVNNVAQELERARQALVEHQNQVAAIEAHYNECLAIVQQEQSPAPSFAPPSVPTEEVVQNEDGSTTKKLKLPNPFEQITANAGQKS